MKKRIKEVIRRFLNILKLPEMQVLPGQLAFYFLMSFVPILAICSIVASYVTKNFNLINELNQVLPKALANILLPFLSNPDTNVNLFILILGYLVVASNGPASIIITSNELYKINDNHFIQIRLKSFIMTLIIILLFLFTLFIPVFGDIIVKFLLNIIGNPISLYKYVGLYKVLKLFTSFIFIYFAIKLLYTIAPNKKIKSKTTTKGSLFTTIGWVGATYIFAFYITNIAKYNLLYGNFANILILLMWIYILAYLFVMGMAVNINNYDNDKK